MTLTCTECGKQYEVSASGVWRHRFVYDHTPAVGKSERKEG
jgi:hypothetical protein